MHLQINNSGAWKNVCEFPAAQVEEVAAAAATLARVLGSKTTWRVVEVKSGGYQTVVLDDAAIRKARAPEPSREAFEAFCRKEPAFSYWQNHDVSLKRIGDSYYSASASDAWRGWKGALEAVGN